MKTAMCTYPSLYRKEDINWKDLEAIGIFPDELEENNQMEKLLRGEKTNIMTLHLMLLGVDVEMDATIQIVEEGRQPVFEIVGIKPEEDDFDPEL